jgi:hypothetical protein
MEALLRPHRAGTVFALGIVSLVAGLFLIPLGLAPWIMGSSDLRAMDRGSVDPAGRTLTQMGRMFGVTGIGLAAIMVALVCTADRWLPAVYRIF